MRLASLVMLMLLSGCVGSYSSMSSSGVAQQSAGIPMGNQAQRDGFYDGGIYSPDLTRRTLPLSE